MSDLISRQALKQAFCRDNQNRYGLEDIAEIIDSVPVAYNVEKVAYQIADHSKALDYTGRSVIDAVKAIEIVREGGVE